MLYVLISFCLFMIIQSIFINGLFIAFSKDNILYPIKEWLGDSKAGKPIASCVKCMASVWGTLTYWPIALWAYDFKFELVYFYIIDVVGLIYLNFFFYKKV